MRIGHGYDAHTFGDDCDLILGGVKIDYEKGLVAHSDGDAVIHALCDALLGAVALGDIGNHFPDDDDAFKNIDSRILLQRVYETIQEKGYRIMNVDITVLAQAPKLAPHIPKMREILSADLGLAVDELNIKATTTEKMGFVGRKEGIAVYAVCLIEKE